VGRLLGLAVLVTAAPFAGSVAGERAPSTDEVVFVTYQCGGRPGEVEQQIVVRGTAFPEQTGVDRREPVAGDVSEFCEPRVADFGERLKDEPCVGSPIQRSTSGEFTTLEVEAVCAGRRGAVLSAVADLAAFAIGK
jgi:hypothetical protein